MQSDGSGSGGRARNACTPPQTPASEQASSQPARPVQRTRRPAAPGHTAPTRRCELEGQLLGRDLPTLLRLLRGQLVLRLLLQRGRRRRRRSRSGSWVVRAAGCCCCGVLPHCRQVAVVQVRGDQALRGSGRGDVLHVLLLDVQVLLHVLHVRHQRLLLLHLRRHQLLLRQHHVGQLAVAAGRVMAVAVAGVLQPRQRRAAGLCAVAVLLYVLRRGRGGGCRRQLRLLLVVLLQGQRQRVLGAGGRAQRLHVVGVAATGRALQPLPLGAGARVKGVHACSGGLCGGSG